MYENFYISDVSFIEMKICLQRKTGTFKYV